MLLINNIRVLFPCSKSDGSECVFLKMETSYTYEDFLALPTGSLKDYLIRWPTTVTAKQKVTALQTLFTAKQN